nr:hypothetical protein [Clostridioides sp.]
MVRLDDFTKAILEGQKKSKIKKNKHKEYDIKSYEIKKAIRFSLGRR